MNIFSAITSGLQAYNSLSGLNKPTQQPSQDPTWEGMLWPINPTDTRTTLQKLAPKISEVGSKIENSNIVKNISKNVNPIIDTVYSATAKPIVDQVKYTSNINNVKKPYQEQLSSLWLTMQKLDELGLSEEEKQAVKNIYDQVGVEIPWISQKVQINDKNKNASQRNWILENVGWSINDVIWGAISEVPNVVWNAVWFANDISQYNPASYIGGVIWDLWKSVFTDKTFSQARQESSKQTEDMTNTIKWIWKKGKEFAQNNLPFDPNSTSAKVWETITDIWASLVWPNKLWVFRPWFLWTTAKLASEWAIQWAKYWIASEWKIDPKQVAIWAAWNTLIWWAFNIGWKIGKSVIPKTQEEKIAEAVWSNFTKWTVSGKTVKIPVPNEWIITKVTTPFRESDPKILTGRALTPSYAGKTPKQMLKSVWEMTDNVKSLYSHIRTGKMKWNINTLEDAANTVISNLDSVGANIWSAIKWAKWTVIPSVWTMDEITNTLTNKIESRSGAFKPLQNFLEDTKNWLNLQDAFKAKKVYQAEITKLIKSGDAGTDSYSALVKWVQELTDNIDNAVEKSLWSKQLIEWKKQYRLLKSIASDISKSAVVEWRRAPQTFVEQLWTLQAITDGITSPLSTAKQLFAKEIWELNTRGWAWKELISNYDKQAIKWFNNPIVTPKKIKVWQ